jgi:hypothetical protein
MATRGKAKPAGDAGKSLKVISRPDRFRRCGREFTASPTLIPLDELSEDELIILQAETKLVTEVVDTPKAEGAKA